MKTVLIRAPLLSISGYGVHSRQIFRWLMTQSVEVITQIVPWGNTSWMINPTLENGLIGEIIARSRSPEETPRPDVTIQVQLPNEWDPNLGDVNVGVSAWVETETCNPEWVAAANKMTRLVVPSSFTKGVIERSGAITRPLHVIPESFIDQVTLEDLPELDLDHKLETDFNFLMIGQITGNSPESDRKNNFFTLKWICEQFKDDPNVGVIIKTNSARGTTIDKTLTRQTLNRALSQVKKSPYPRVYLLHGEMKSEELVALYRHSTVKALVSLTRGEGWGLSLLEAAAVGLPVIATNWSGHLDFLKLGKFIPVNYSLAPIPESRVDNKIFMSGARWAIPDEIDAKRKLFKMREKPSIPTRWAQELMPIIRSSFSQEAINMRYTEELGELLR